MQEFVHQQYAFALSLWGSETQDLGLWVSGLEFQEFGLWGLKFQEFGYMFLGLKV